MASMSHCCIENTAEDMAQVLEKFTEHQDDVQRNPYELASIKGLYELCKEYVKEYEKYIDDEEAYIATHSDPDYDDDY